MHRITRKLSTRRIAKKQAAAFSPGCTGRRRRSAALIGKPTLRHVSKSLPPPHLTSSSLELALPKHLVENVHRLPQIPAISSPYQLLHGVVLCCLRLDLQTGGFPSSVSSSLLWVLFCIGSSCATVLGFSGRQTTQFVL
ncbi:hypothetical protein CDAR_170521 [Caerostris darwini]|uniref:Uncharacterized protein n=1 Tax=Caerostris darwini TaxID=1538125 RepID=A0AAV4R7Z5_9ARAC|nr:hypothetical protein CDAR_170521 [Caerostris darwini]